MANAVSVRYTFVETPLGRLFVATTPAGVARVGFPEENPDHLLEELEDALGPAEEKRDIPDVREAFDDYFEGRRQGPILEPDTSLVADGFGRRVLRATSAIPFGSVSTYGDVAARAGSPRGGRAAGNALRGNPVPLVIPCHRVVPASGGIGGYAGHEERKAFLLDMEGALRP